MAGKTEYPKGFNINNKQNTPNYVLAKIGIHKKTFTNFMLEKEGEWINIDIKKGEDGNVYAAVDNFKRDATKTYASEPIPTERQLENQRKKEESKQELNDLINSTESINPDDIPF